MALAGWVRPGVTLAAGVITASQLGEVSPVSTAINRDLDLSPAAGGVAISLITLVAAAAATPVALGTRRWPASRLVLLGLVSMAVPGALTATVARSETVFLLLRGVAGFGYVLVVVAGPSLLLGQVGPARRSWALALWGSCTPAGLALAAAAGGGGGAFLGWRGWFAVVAAVMAVTAVAVALLSTLSANVEATKPGAASAVGPLRSWSVLGRPLCLAAAFCLIASISVAVASLLPSYLHSARGLSETGAGSVTSLVAIASVPGSVVTGALLRRHVRPPVLGIAILGCPVAAALGFTGTPLTIAVLADIGLVFLAGIGVAATYGALPTIAAAPGVLPLANGLLVQLGSLGTLIAPPIFAAATGLARWSLMPILLLLPAVGGAALLATAARFAFPKTRQRVGPVIDTGRRPIAPSTSAQAAPVPEK